MLQLKYDKMDVVEDAEHRAGRRYRAEGHGRFIEDAEAEMGDRKESPLLTSSPKFLPIYLDLSRSSIYVCEMNLGRARLRITRSASMMELMLREEESLGNSFPPESR